MRPSPRRIPARKRMAHPKIDVDVLDRQSEARIDHSRIVQAVTFVLERHERAIPVSILLTDDVTIRDMNRRFLNHDWATDVITFPRDEDDFAAPEGLSDEAGTGGGDLGVSVETARRESAERGADVEAEVLLYVVHGVLHLLGFDDRDDESSRRMNLETGEILWALGIDASSLGADFGRVGS